MWNEASQGTWLQCKAASNFTWLWISPGRLRQSHEICELLPFQPWTNILSAAVPIGHVSILCASPAQCLAQRWPTMAFLLPVIHSVTHIFLFGKIIIYFFRNTMYYSTLDSEFLLSLKILLEETWPGTWNSLTKWGRESGDSLDLGSQRDLERALQSQGRQLVPHWEARACVPVLYSWLRLSLKTVLWHNYDYYPHSTEEEPCRRKNNLYMVLRGQAIFSTRVCLSLEPMPTVLQYSEEEVNPVGAEVTFILIDLLFGLCFILTSSG